MGESMDQRAAAAKHPTELDEFDIAINPTGQSAILALRRKDANQAETFQITTERLRNACRPLFDQEVVEELRQIRQTLSRLEGAVPLSDEIATSLFAMIEANYRLSKRGTG